MPTTAALLWLVTQISGGDLLFVDSAILIKTGSPDKHSNRFMRYNTLVLFSFHEPEIVSLGLPNAGVGRTATSWP